MQQQREKKYFAAHKQAKRKKKERKTRTTIRTMCRRGGIPTPRKSVQVSYWGKRKLCSIRGKKKRAVGEYQGLEKKTGGKRSFPNRKGGPIIGKKGNGKQTGKKGEKKILFPMGIGKERKQNINLTLPKVTRDRRFPENDTTVRFLR